jgi:succinate dehydrogenase / fumarate reductase, membrane anchor subunit
LDPIRACLDRVTQQGLVVICEDVEAGRARFAAVIAIQLCCYGFAVVGIIATLRIAFGS